VVRVDEQTNKQQTLLLLLLNVISFYSGDGIFVC